MQYGKGICMAGFQNAEDYIADYSDQKMRGQLHQRAFSNLRAR